MDLELKETCENLRELSKGLREKKECEAFLRLNEEGYIENNIKIEKPELKEIEEIEEPTKPNFSKAKLRLMTIAGFLCMIIMPAFCVQFENLTLIYVLIGVTVILCWSLIFTPIFLNQKITNYEEKLKSYQNTIKKNEENSEYNKMYPELLDEYNFAITKCIDEYNKKYIEYKEKITTSEQIIKKYDGIIAPKFYENIDEIIGIIEDGRADSLKEALNIFVSDSRQRELVKAQQESNRIAEQQMWDAQRHNREMEEQARRQSDAVKQQEEARRKGAPNCWQCKNWPCGGDPAYCGSFVKKQ